VAETGQDPGARRPNRPRLNVYAHCLRGTAGGVTVMAINLKPSAATIQVSGPAEVYALTSPQLTSKTVLLNGRPLKVGTNDTLPTINPVKRNRRHIALAGHT
jgi:heparanase 1